MSGRCHPGVSRPQERRVPRDCYDDPRSAHITNRTEAGEVDYVKGANIGGFKKVADAMVAYGVV